MSKNNKKKQWTPPDLFLLEIFEDTFWCLHPQMGNPCFKHLVPIRIHLNVHSRLRRGVKRFEIRTEQLLDKRGNFRVRSVSLNFTDQVHLNFQDYGTGSVFLFRHVAKTYFEKTDSVSILRSHQRKSISLRCAGLNILMRTTLN